MRKGFEFDFHFPPILRKLKRGPQIILPKDLGIIAAFAGIGKDSIVIDAGTGSAYAAVFFASIAKKVITYEEREEFAKFARKNIARSELDNIVLRQKDVFNGVRERADTIMLDLPNPERIFKSKFNLKEGGTIVGYLPHVEQVRTFVMAAQKAGFESSTVRCFVEDLLVREFGTRPTNKGITHTAYLVFAKKRIAEEKGQQNGQQRKQNKK
jgi:tRNA (adenine57-N1/adenine58-N1)-methyltransferase